MRLASLSDAMTAPPTGWPPPNARSTPQAPQKSGGCGCGCGGKKKSGGCCPQNQASNTNKLPLNLNIEINPTNSINSGTQTATETSYANAMRNYPPAVQQAAAQAAAMTAPPQEPYRGFLPQDKRPIDVPGQFTPQTTGSPSKPVQHFAEFT